MVCFPAEPISWKLALVFPFSVVASVCPKSTPSLTRLLVLLGFFVFQMHKIIDLENGTENGLDAGEAHG